MDYVKFTVIYKYSKELKQYMSELIGKEYGEGCKLVEIATAMVTEKKFLRTITYRALVLHCEGSLDAYLLHGKHYGKYAVHRAGWL